MPESLPSFLARLEPLEACRLSAHDAPCCHTASAWFRARARGASTGPFPAWVSVRWQWGPHPWPFAWCEAIAASRVDCGAFAALCASACAANGLDARPVQIVERFDPGTTRNWRARWESASVPPTWLSGPHAYHELVAIEAGGAHRLWDPTDGRELGAWTAGGRTVVAVRAHTPNALRPAWGAPIPSGRWHLLERAPCA